VQELKSDDAAPGSGGIQHTAGSTQPIQVAATQHVTAQLLLVY
jgi:hypothetical protein